MIVTNITPKIAYTIYKTVFNIIGLLSLILLIITTALYLNINISQILKSNNIQNESFFIQFQDKLSLKVDKLIIPEFESSSEESSTIPTVKEIYKYIKFFKLAVDSIKVDSLQIGKYFTGDIFYKDGLFKIRSDKNLAKFRIDIDKTKICLNILDLNYVEYGIKLKGKILLNIENNETVFYANISLKDDTNLSVAGQINNFKNILIRAKSEEIISLKTIFDILELPKSAYIWGINRAGYRYIKLNLISTNFQISNPKQALKNLEVNGEIRDLKYRFEPNLDPIRSDKVDIKIFNNNLYINLQDLQIGKNIVRNRVQIKGIFSRPHLFIKANTYLKIDKTILKIIKYYSDLERLPVAISGGLKTDFFMDMKLYDDIAMRFIAKVDIQQSVLQSENIPNVVSGKIYYRYPENILKVENTKFNYKNLTDGKISGIVDIENSKLNLNAILNRIYIDENSSMQSSNLKLNMFGNFQEVKVNLSPTVWKFSNIRSELSNFQVQYFKNVVKIRDLHTNLDEFNLSTRIDIDYYLKDKFSKINLDIDRFKFSELDINKENFQIFVHLKDRIKIDIPKILTEIGIDKTKSLKFGNIAVFRQYIPLLQKYPKLSGDVSIKIDENISIDGSLHLRQKVIKYGDNFIENFNFNGLIQDENIKISINDKIFINKSQNIDILIDDYDFNLTGINQFMDNNSTDVNNSNSETNSSIDIQPEINIYLNRTSIFLTDLNHRFNSKSIFFTAFGDKIYLKTIPLRRGEITFETKENRYILRAINLDKQFISSISNFDGISGGNYNIYLKGEKGNFKGFAQFGTLKIKNMDFINNILAFINTVPALLTFSRPGFNHNGLRILAGFVEFEKFENRIYFRDIQIKGESVDFSGSGYIDIENSLIDMQIDISAVKYLDKFIDNIPVANYLILGDDGSIATRIVIKGKLDDPKISSEIHKDILYSPFQLTGRVFNLPVKILEVFKSLNLNDKQNQENVQQFLKDIGF